MADKNSTTGIPALFADFDVTLQDPKERAPREIGGENGIPEQTVQLMQYLYDNNKRMTLSFKGGKDYNGKQGEEAAKAFVLDAKDSSRHVKPRSEHANGLTIVANADGIVVTVSVGQKRGRTAKTS